MNVVFRVDSSIYMGIGHLMRCLSLAGELRAKDILVKFICSNLPGNQAGILEKNGYTVHLLPYNASQTEVQQTINTVEQEVCKVDWIIIDHYAIDEPWEKQLRPYIKRIMVIDDLANRRHDCDLLLDQNYYDNMKSRYEGLVSNHCRKLLGPKYALLRPEFLWERKNLRTRDGLIRRILIFYGGTDPGNETEKALKAIRKLNLPGVAIDVVVGSTNPNRVRIGELCSSIPGVSFYCQVDNMAQLTANADLALCAGGSATHERCMLGLPSIVTIIADNQLETTAVLDKAGAVRSIGLSRDVTVKKIADAVAEAIANPEAVRDIGKRALQLTAEHISVAEMILEETNAK